MIGRERWRYYAWRYRTRRDPERETDDRERLAQGPVARILWRRRAWGWVAVLALAGYAALAATLLIEGTTPGGVGRGTGPALTAAEWLAGAVGTGTVGALSEGLLLRRHRSAHRTSLSPRSSPAWWLGVLALLALAGGLLVLPVWDLPEAVDAWGYATGAQSSATFVAQSSYQDCQTDDNGDQNCTWDTDGYLMPGHQPAVWPSYLAAGQTQVVSRPLWDWLHGDQLIDGAANDVEEIFVGLAAGLFLVGSVFVGGLTIGLAANLALNKVT